MPKANEKIQKHFIKDGDDNYMPRRPIRYTSPSVPKQPYKQCECGGKLKPRGALDFAGRTSTKCNKCGIRIYAQHYKGAAGLVECY